MSKTKRSNPSTAMSELSLDALDDVIGGSSPAPIGLGGSPHAHPVAGYTDHFNLNLGHAAATPSALALPATGPAPFGLGGSAGSHTDTSVAPADHRSEALPVSAGSAFTQLDASSQDPSLDAQDASANHDAGPEGLGGNT